MTLKAVVSYLDYRLKANEEQTLFEVFVAENLSTMAAGQKYKQRMSYKEKRDTLWGISAGGDTRSGRQIIEDTFAKRGMKIIKKGENK